MAGEPAAGSALRVARWGIADLFAGATDDREVTDLDGLGGDEDLLVVEAGVARQHARALRGLGRRSTGPAVVVAGRAGTRRRIGDLALVRGADSAAGTGAGGTGAGGTGEAGADALVLPPAVDVRRDNPVGWRRWARHPAVAVLTRVTDAAALGVLADPLHDVQVLLGPGVGAGDLPEPVAARVSTRLRDLDDLRERLRRFRVLVDDLAWHEDATTALQLRLRALALGTPVVAGDPQLASSGLPGSVAPDAVIDRVRDLVGDDAERERTSVLGRRAALRGHTGTARVRAVWAALGHAVPPPPRVSVLLATNRPALLGHAAASVARQRHPDVELVAILHGHGFEDLGPLERHPGPVRIVRAPEERVLGACLNLGLAEATGELVAKMDDDDHYGRDHLGDLVLALGYSGAALVGRRIEHVHLADRDVTLTREQSNVERFGIHVSGPTLLTTRRLLDRYRFLEEPRRVDSTLLERLAADEEPVYGTHALDVVLERSGGGHTWGADVGAMLERAVTLTDGLDLERTASEPGAFSDRDRAPRAP